METKTKLVKAVKDYFFTLALAVTFIGFSAFKYVHSTQAPEDGWYEVIPDAANPNDESLQQIGQKLDQAPPQSGAGCSQDNTGHRCAVELEFESSATAVPPTVADIDAYDASMAEDAAQPLL